MRSGVLSRVAGLEKLSAKELKEEWRALMGSEPPTASRTYLVKRLAYRIQELAYGGVSEATREKLRDLIPEGALEVDGAAKTRKARRRGKPGAPVAGTKLVREWQGRRYEVTAVQGGFEFEGKRYRSLTAIVKVITGTHWNGPAFFGLRKPEKQPDGQS